MKMNIKILFLLQCCISFLSFSSNYSSLQEAFQRHNYLPSIDQRKFEQFILTGASYLPSSNNDVSIDLMQHRKQFTTFAESYIKDINTFFENKQYEKALEYIQNWLALSYFSNGLWYLHCKIIDILYPQFYSINLPNEVRMEIVALLDKYLQPLTNESYHNVIKNEHGEEISMVSNLLLYCWFQECVLSSIYDGVLHFDLFKQRFDKILEEIKEKRFIKISLSFEPNDSFTLAIYNPHQNVAFTATSDAIFFRFDNQFQYNQNHQ